MAKEPIYLDNKGKLVRRASFAHNDWLQALAEWGAAGWVAVILALGFLLTRLARAWRRPAASSLAILGGLLVLAVHAWYDFLLFQPQLVLLAVAVAWLMVLEHGDSEHAL
jgi:O-antigen ligase